MTDRQTSPLGRAHVATLGHVGSATINRLIAASIIVAGLYIGKPVLVPIAMAVLLAFVLSPIVQTLRRIRVPHGLAVALVVLIAFASLIGLGAVLTSQIGDLAEDIPRYETELRDKVRDLRGATMSSGAMERAARTLNDLKTELERPDPSAEALPSAAPPQAPPGSATQSPPSDKPIPVEVHYPEPKPLESVLAIVSTLIEPIAMLAIVVVFVFFILLQRQDLRDRVIRLVGAGDFQRTTAAMNDAGTRLSRYLFTLTTLNLAFGVLIAMALWLIGVPAPLLWGILAALMRFVPFVGSFIAAAFPVILAAAIDTGWSTLWMTVALFVVAEAAMSQFVEPLVQSQTTGLSPVAVVASAAFWTMLWGPIGLILAVPLTVCLVVLGQHVDSLAFLHVMLGDEPALSPPERFYQRVLAGDANEISEQGEEQIHKTSLSAFYETVAVAALRLAEADSDRGLLSEEHLSRIGATVATMVDNLWDYEDAMSQTTPSVTRRAGGTTARSEADTSVEPRPAGAAHLPVLAREALPESWRAGTPILCIPARSRLDHAASALVAHVLTRHGIDTEVLEPGKASSAQLNALGRDEPRAVCICSLGERDRALPARFIARRLRRLWPGAHIIAVVWAAAAEDQAQIMASDAASIDAMATTIAGAAEEVLMLAGAEPTRKRPAGGQPDTAKEGSASSAQAGPTPVTVAAG